MQKNLVEALGRDYVRQMCAGAVFRIGDREAHYLRDVREDGYLTRMVDLDSSSPKWKSAVVPLDKLTSLSDFSYPKLGYRNLFSPSHGHIVVSLNNRRSAQRGLRVDHLNAEYMSIYQSTIPEMYEAWHATDTPGRIKIVYRPLFVSFAEGAKQLIAGETLAFAVNEDIAVVLSGSARGNKVADVRFKDKVVGSVDEDGNISLSNKILQRASLRSKFEK